MGAWGEGIYDDDVAEDARDAYREILSKGLDGSEATDRFLKLWKGSTNDSDDGPVIWFALAETQWKLGRLEDRVRDAAIKRIDDGSSLDRWREAGDKALAKRQKVLATLKQKLLSPQPALKKIRIEQPLQPIVAGKPLKPAELRKQLRALHCLLEPSRGGALTSVDCLGGMTDKLLGALASCADTLVSLDISGSPKLTAAGLQVIGQFRHLQRLALSDVPLTDELLSHFQELKQLERLELRGRAVTDAGLAHFSDCARLKVLELGGTSIGDKTIAWISRLPDVREVWVRGTQVTDQGVGMLKNHPGVRQLYVARTAITDRGAAHAAQMPKLIWLDLEGTGISDTAISGLVKSRSLQGLDLCGTAVTDKCLPHLLRMKQLCFLNVEKTGITEAGQRRLKEELPLLENQEARTATYEAMRQ